jgi:hypothetical protein
MLIDEANPAPNVHSILPAPNEHVREVLPGQWVARAMQLFCPKLISARVSVISRRIR